MTVTSFANDITVETHIVAISCGECGVTYGLGAEFIQARRKDQREANKILGFRHLSAVPAAATQACLVHAEPDVRHCRGCAADLKAGEIA